MDKDVDSRLGGESVRRPLASRNLKVFRMLSSYLVDQKVSPNFISFLSIVFAIVSAIFFILTNRDETSKLIISFYWILGAIFVQLRLLANMLDGMVAIEMKNKNIHSGDSNYISKLGKLFNEVPDRISDVIILIGFGMSLGGSLVISLLASCGALLTAYIRAEGAVVGAKQCFNGPMAKPQRMFLITLGAILCSFISDNFLNGFNFLNYKIPEIILIIIFVGTIITFIFRLYKICKSLKIS